MFSHIPSYSASFSEDSNVTEYAWTYGRTNNWSGFWRWYKILFCVLHVCVGHSLCAWVVEWSAATQGFFNIIYTKACLCPTSIPTPPLGVI